MQIHKNYLWIRKVGFSFVILKMHVVHSGVLKVNSRKLALGSYADLFFKTAVLTGAGARIVRKEVIKQERTKAD